MTGKRRPWLRKIVASVTSALTVTLLFAQIGTSARAQSGSKNPITHESMWAFKRVGAPVPSPDGKLVVFSVTDAAYDEKDQSTDLWIVATSGGAAPRRLTSTRGGESGNSRGSMP